MLRHLVLLTLEPGTSAEARDAIVEGLRALPAKIDSIRSYEVGVDLGLNPGNATVAVVAQFDDVAGYRHYQTHPEHLAVIDERITPVCRSRLGIQFEV